jgi:serine protease Do
MLLALAGARCECGPANASLLAITETTGIQMSTPCIEGNSVCIFMVLKRTLVGWMTAGFLCSSIALPQRPPATPNPQKTDVLRELSTSFEEISQRSGKAVVQIFVRSYVAADESNSGGQLLTTQNSSGSGIIMSPDGYILTNAHVVKGAHSLKVQLNVRAEAEAHAQGIKGLNRPLTGTLVGVDRETDLAVIKIDERHLPYLEFGDSNSLKQGQLVLALGNPLGLDNSVSLGVVSAVARQIKPDDTMVYIQTDAPINPGNSGGPLVDAEGRVMGINTFIYTQSGGSEGIGFSIPSNIAREVYGQLKTLGHVHRAQLGVVAQTITPEMADGLSLPTDHGVIVSDLEPDGPAAHGGVEVDDIIVALNGKRMDTIHQMEANIFRLAPKTKVTLRVQRGDTQLDLPVITEEESGKELDALADAVDPVKNLVPELGIVGLDINKTVLGLMPDLRRPAGVVVAARNANTPYSGSPLNVGDAVYAVNRRVVNSVSQLREILDQMKSGQAAVLLVEREGHLIYVPIALD